MPKLANKRISAANIDIIAIAPARRADTSRMNTTANIIVSSAMQINAKNAAFLSVMTKG